MMRYILFFVIGSLFIFLFPVIVEAGPQRIITIVHPIRSRTLWKDLDAMRDQIRAVTDRKLAVTWLIQYDILSDEPVLKLLKDLPPDHEIGIFLEVDETLARDAFVPYLLGSGDWARADKVLLSGYEPLERKRMIDRVFAKFSEVFGYRPVSVGAWYIDALSSEYLYVEYGIGAMISVADQFQTDGYGLWGQPWGTAYYPSRLHPLMSASDMGNKLPVVKTQWAARDIVRGYGLTVADSIYSVQANDYAGQGLTTDYFEKLLGDYLRAPNALNQITIGIEVGQEGRSYLAEYQRQMDVLVAMRDKDDIEILTMKQFSDLYREEFPNLTPESFVSGTDFDNPQKEGYWYSSSGYRVGLLKENGQLKIRDLRSYSGMLVTDDIVQKDTEQKLKRIIPAEIDDSRFGNSRLLLDTVGSVSARRIDGIIALDIISADGAGHILELKPEDIVLDGQSIWKAPQDTSMIYALRRTLAGGILMYAAASPHHWAGGIRFSSINGIPYAGLWLYPDRLYGFSTRFPFAGSFPFPFWVLSHFRSPPSLDPIQWVLQAIM